MPPGGWTPRLGGPAVRYEYRSPPPRGGGCPPGGPGARPRVPVAPWWWYGTRPVNGRPVRSVAGGSEALADELRLRIRTTGPLPFAAFMRLALYHPLHGYYATRVPGHGADYRTSRSISPWFGRLVAQALGGVWEELGRPDPFWSSRWVQGWAIWPQGPLRRPAHWPAPLRAIRRAVRTDGCLAASPARPCRPAGRMDVGPWGGAARGGLRARQ